MKGLEDAFMGRRKDGDAVVTVYDKNNNKAAHIYVPPERLQEVVDLIHKKAREEEDDIHE